MKAFVRAAVAVCALAALPLTAAADPLTYEALKTMVTGMGYTPKEIGETTPKMEITVTTEAFNVPLGLEVTKSGRYVWATANLGQSTLDGARALEMIKRGTEFQPTQFWITSSNNLTIGLAINNIDIAPDTLKFAVEKLAADVGKSASLWQAPAPATPQ